MSADYPAAEEHLVPRSFMFNSNACKAIVIHKTGGDATPQAVYNTFINSGNPGKSSHFAIGTDGTIWQFVPESLGAGANGVTDNTTEAFWQPYIAQYGNLNTCTISIEHCDPSPNNDTPLTAAQKQASFALVAHLCQKYGIAADHIKPHKSIVSTACPGNYPMQELQDFIQQGGSMPVPTGWTPTSDALIAKNGIPVRLGFRQHIESAATWDADNQPYEAEYHASPAQVHAPEFGDGQRQCFRDCILWYTPDKGVIQEGYMGWELDACYKKIAALEAEIATLKSAPQTVTLNPDVIAQLATASTALAAVTAAVSKAQSELPK